jgi:hypothetical protein
VIGLRVALVTAVPVTGLRAAPVSTVPVVTPFTAEAIVGVMPVTTLVPGVPVASLTTFAKVGLTLVTHVAADAEYTSPVFRLPTVSAARSVWFEADANSASRTPARRGTIVRFGLIITRPHESGLAQSIV